MTKKLKKEWGYLIPLILSIILGVRKGFSPDTYNKYVYLLFSGGAIGAFACVSLSSRKVFSQKVEKVCKAVCLFMPFTVATIDNDTYWIIAVGRNVILHGFDRIDRINFYHFHSIVQQWLVAVSFASVDRLFGLKGIVVISGLIGLLLVLVTYKAVENSKIPWTITFCTMTAFMIFLTSRPFMISALLLAVEYLEYRKNKLWMIPLTGILFINVHMALWPMQILLLGTLLVESLFERTLSLGKIICVALIVPLSVLNPYGMEGFMYPFHIMSKNISYIGEMASPFSYLSTASIVMMVELSFSVLVIIIALVRRKKLRIGPVIALAGTMAMACTAGRHVILTGIPLPYVLSDFASGETVKRKERAGQVISGAMIAMMCCCCFFMGVNNGRNIYEKAFNTLDNYQRGVLYTGMDAGGYAAYRGYHSYIDARTEPHYELYNGKFDYWDEYINSLRHGAEGIVEKYHFNYALCLRDIDDSMIKEMKKHKAKVIYSDKNCILYMAVEKN